MLIIGSHVSFNKEQLLSSVKEAISYNENAFMFYTGAPQNTMRSPIRDEYTYEAYKLMKENNISLDHVICHAPYLVNLAHPVDSDKHRFSVDFLIGEIKRCETLGIKYMVLHPGNAVKMTKDEALNNIASGINSILEYSNNVVILLETMAGKGTECGTNIIELQTIINKVIKNNLIGVCLDTCHLNDSGVDLNNFDGYLEEFDKLIGINKIGCVHINDSKNIIGSHKDRHANIGFGNINFATILNIIYHEKLKNVPKILETPYIGNTDDSLERLYPPYKFEIEMIKNKTFNSNILNNIRDYYKN